MMIRMKKIMTASNSKQHWEGDMIFDRDDRIDEVMNYDYDDDEEHVDPETTKTGEVYIFI